MIVWKIKYELKGKKTTIDFESSTSQLEAMHYFYSEYPDARIISMEAQLFS
jgi:hypothetical protein